MVSLRDLDSLLKFSTLLTIVLFTAAILTDLGIIDEHYNLTAETVVVALGDLALVDWAFNHSFILIQIVIWLLFLGILVSIVVLCLNLI